MKKRKRKCVWCGKRNVPYKGMVCNDCIRDLCGMDNIEIVEKLDKLYKMPIKWDYVIDYKKYNPDSKPTYEELVEALKDTHNLYLQAVKDKYFTHDITRIMSNDSIFLRLKHNE